MGSIPSRGTKRDAAKTYIRSKASKENWEKPEYRELISKRRREEWQDKEIREKCLKNLDRSGKARSQKVQCIETGIIYQSMRDAERLTGISHVNISQVCNGKRETARGFHWKK